MDTSLQSPVGMLLALLREALGAEEKEQLNDPSAETAFWQEVINIADKHAVLPLLFDVATERGLPEILVEISRIEGKRMATQYYRLLFLASYVVNRLKEAGIETAILKGVSTSSFYPVPEYRKSGDVDLILLSDAEEKKIDEIMLAAGFAKKKDEQANHHLVYETPEEIEVELHCSFVEDFSDKRINEAMKKYLKECAKHTTQQEICGVTLPVLDRCFHGYELLLHMLQHFMASGFGIKLLCDWVVLWRQPWEEEEIVRLREMIDAGGLTRFASAISCVCVEYLGLEKEKVPLIQEDGPDCALLLEEIMKAWDIGRSDSNRLVTMTGTGIGAYIREFHHQMHINFPKLGKCFLFWPVLWMITLIRFLINNHRVRKTSVWAVLREAGRRNRLIEQLDLFE